MPIRVLTIFAACFLWMNESWAASPAIKIGLDADMTGSGKISGQAIERGARIAIEQINAAGGVLGRSLQIDIRDHQGKPEIGAANIDAFAKDSEVIAVLGGLHTPVVLHELQRIHGHGIPFLNPWAAGTAIVSNGFEPNYVFRSSVRDEWAGKFLVRAGIEIGHKKFGLALIRNPWGRSNQLAMTKALEEAGLSPVGVEWILSPNDDFSPNVERLRQAGADVVLLVADAPYSVPLISAMADRPEAERLPIISHWGVTGGNLFDRAGEQIANLDLCFLQTYSFFDPSNDELNRNFIQDYATLIDVQPTPSAIKAPVGAAHAYDMVRMLAVALESAGEVNRLTVRQAIQDLDSVEGLLKNYRQPFQGDFNEALTIDDYRLAYFGHQGEILPVTAGDCGQDR